MPHDRSAVQTQLDTHESLGALLRSRALASSPRLLIGQAAAGVALNASVLAWHPERWGIATAAAATVALHALWSVAVQRTSFEYDVEQEATAARLDEAASHPPRTVHRGWWYTRRVAAVGASTSALLLLWFVCMMLLGRLIS